MGLWDFFRRKKEEPEEFSIEPKRIKDFMEDKRLSGSMAENTADAAFGSKETAFAEVEEQKVDFNSREESAGYVQNCCERIMEVSKQVEEAKAEYGAVTSYLMDMQKIDMIPKEEREELESAARDIITFTREREKYREDNEIKISASARQTMQKYEKEMVNEIRKMQENEAYQRAIKNDLKYLEGEKGYLKYQRQEIIAKQTYLRNIAVTTSVLVIILFVLLYALARVFRADMRLPFTLTILMAAVSAAYIYFEANKNRANMVLTEKKINKAIGLLNKVKIKYVNNTSYLDYTYEKFGVSSAMELEHIWQQYEEIKRRERKIRNNTDKLNANSEMLIAQLKKYEIEDPDIWIHQPAAIIDKKEMVEIRHRLNVRRQKLRDRIDYNNKIKMETAARVQAVLEQKPELKEEVVEMLHKYNVEI